MSDNTSAPRARRAIVIGGSMGGLFAASLLRRIGWRPDLYERNETELFGRGAGIVTHDDLLQSLRLAGADLTDLGVQLTDRIALDRQGRVIERMPFEQIVTSWDRLHQILRATIPAGAHHLGCRLVRVEQNADSVTAVFSNGRRETADLLIAADGFRSTVRQQFAPEIQPIYAGYVVWRGLAAEANIPPEAHKAIFNTFAFYLPPNNKNIGYPIAGPDNDLRPGHRRYNWVWYRPVPASRLNDMLRGSDGVQYEVSLPPPKVRQELIEQLKRDAREFLTPAMREILEVIDKPFFTPIYDHFMPQMVYGRVAFIGDAAATARPHVGMGVAKAGTDAEVLAEEIARHGDDIDAGLAVFNRERVDASRRAVLRGRDLGEYMLAEDGHGTTHEDDPHWVEFHSVRGILKHTASSAFLRAPA
jgi:2-polyprenyl-6-methoxyphenol hydroxylase-like FAD-dependent oxidoreductase